MPEVTCYVSSGNYSHSLTHSASLLSVCLSGRPKIIMWKEVVDKGLRSLNKEETMVHSN